MYLKRTKYQALNPNLRTPFMNSAVSIHDWYPVLMGWATRMGWITPMRICVKTASLQALESLVRNLALQNVLTTLARKLQTVYQPENFPNTYQIKLESDSLWYLSTYLLQMIRGIEDYNGLANCLNATPAKTHHWTSLRHTPLSREQPLWRAEGKYKKHCQCCMRS